LPLQVFVRLNIFHSKLPWPRESRPKGQFFL
jgi:hypothetical protein